MRSGFGGDAGAGPPLEGVEEDNTGGIAGVWPEPGGGLSPNKSIFRIAEPGSVFTKKEKRYPRAEP